MASESYVLDKTYQADGALTQYAVVVYGGVDGHCNAPASQKANKVAGVVQETASASGDTVRVRKAGITKVVASEAISLGMEVSINDIQGRVYDPTVFASGDGVVGVMEEAATASGDIVDCWLQIRTELG